MLKSKKFMLFIVMVLVIQVFGVVGMISASAEDPDITIGTTTSTPGHSTIIPVNINDTMNGIHNAHIVISFDSTELRCDSVSLSPDSIVPVAANFTSSISSGQVILNYSDNSVDGDEITTAGLLAYLVMAPANTVYPKDISISVVAADTYFTLYNDATQTYENVTNLPHQDGYITIIDPGNSAIHVGTASGTPGSMIWVPVEIDTVYTGGIHSSYIKLKYDTTKLTLTGVVGLDLARNSGGSFNYGGSAADGTVWLSYSDQGIDGHEITRTGTLASLTFNIKSTATAGKTGISVMDPDSYFSLYFDSLKLYRNVTYLPRTNGFITIN